MILTSEERAVIITALRQIGAQKGGTWQVGSDPVKKWFNREALNDLAARVETAVGIDPPTEDEVEAGCVALVMAHAELTRQIMSDVAGHDYEGIIGFCRQLSSLHTKWGAQDVDRFGALAEQLQEKDGRRW